MPPSPFTDVFADLPDPRRETANKLHHLTDILVIATCAMVGSFVDSTWLLGGDRMRSDTAGVVVDHGGDESRSNYGKENGNVVAEPL